MPSSHILIERLLEAHTARRIKLPVAAKSYIEALVQKATAVPPDLNLEEATIVEVLHRTYLPWEAK